jgi:putative ABC transport system permease protein
MRVTDLRAALGAIGRTPLIPLLVVLLTAAGLGSAIAMWSMVDATYLRPLPVPSAHRLVTVFEVHPERGRMAVAPANFLDWSHTTTAFAALSGSQWIEVSLTGQQDSMRLTGARVLPAFFTVWGVAPLLGRTILDEDFGRGQRVAVLSERVWRERLGGDPRAIGSTIRIDGATHTLIGVMPGASSSIGHVEVWLPWDLSPEERAERRYHLVSVIGRLREDRSATDANAELEAAYASLARDYPAATRDWRAIAVPLRDTLLEATGTAVISMAAIVALTFAVTCLNVGSLLTAWWSGRRRELLTRMALGATRPRLVGQLLGEACLVASAGFVVAFPLAHGCLELLGVLTAAPAQAFDFQPALDVRAGMIGAGTFVFFVLATALCPALRLVRSASRLTSDVRSTTQREGRPSMIAQIAGALMAMVISAALVENVRGLKRLTRTDARQPQAMEVVLPDTRYADDASQREYFTRLLSALRARPEVASVAATSYVPPTQAVGNLRFTVEGRATPSDAQSASPAAVDGEAFSALGIALVRGRLFDERDGAGMPPVCVVSEALARRYWGDVDPIGERLHVVGLERPLTIVGIVTSVRQPISTDPRAETVLYLPFAQVPWPFMTLLVTPTREPAAAIAAVTREVARIDDAIAPGAARPLEEVQTEWLRSPRLHATAVTVFGAASLILTLAGLYARMVYVAARRRREWAVRQALGATPARLRRAIAREVGAVAAAGLAAGLCALPALSGVVSGLVYGADLLDWHRALLIATLLGAGAVLAGTAPSRGATRLDLAKVLRQE